MPRIPRLDLMKHSKQASSSSGVDKQDFAELPLKLNNLSDSHRSLLLLHLEHIDAVLNRYTLSLAIHRAFLAKPLCEYPPSNAYVSNPPHAFLPMRYPPTDPSDVDKERYIQPAHAVAERTRRRLQRTKKLPFPDPFPQSVEGIPQPTENAQVKAVSKAEFSKEYLAKVRKGLHKLKKDSTIVRDLLVALIADGKVKDGFLARLSGESKSLRAKELKKRVVKYSDMRHELVLQVKDMLEMKAQAEMAVHNQVLQVAE